MNKKIIVGIVLMIMTGFMTSCQIASAEGAKNSAEDAKDTFVGVYVTEGMPLDEKIEAKKTEISTRLDDGSINKTIEWKFDDDAILLTCPVGYSENGESTYVYEECEKFAYASGSFLTDNTNGEVTENNLLSGTLYTIKGTKVDINIYNVFQRADGSMYAVCGGNGVTILDIGTTVSREISDSEKGITVKAEIKVKTIVETESISIIEMANGGQMLSKNDYSVSDVPEVIVPSADCKYILIEEHKQDGSTEPMYIGSDTCDFYYATKGAGLICDTNRIMFKWSK